MRILIRWDKGEIMGLLSEGATARGLARALPLSATANTWGNEVYFGVPVKSELADDARQVVAAGTICFWVQGSSVAIPFGPTPVSVGNECRLVTAVNVIGRLEGDPKVLATIQDGDTIEVSLADPPA